jgi:hypothetical protein
MSIQYGIKDCNHVWRYRKNGWEEECAPAICIECGAYGCLCDFDHSKLPQEVFFGEGVAGDANLNGKWVNPSVEAKKEEARNSGAKSIEAVVQTD